MKKGQEDNKIFTRKSDSNLFKLGWAKIRRDIMMRMKVRKLWRIRDKIHDLWCFNGDGMIFNDYMRYFNLEFRD